jgi:hypothetical protein
MTVLQSEHKGLRLASSLRCSLSPTKSASMPLTDKVHEGAPLGDDDR